MQLIVVYLGTSGAMFEQVVKYFTVFLSSMIKFIGGPLSGTAFGLSWVETCIFTVLGMMTSVLIFSLLGANVRARLFKKRRLFTTRNRRIVRIWRRYGLAGVAFLTPLLFSPIIGTIVATSFGESWRRIFVYMFVSALFWGVTFSLLVQSIGKAVF